MAKIFDRTEKMRDISASQSACCVALQGFPGRVTSCYGRLDRPEWRMIIRQSVLRFHTDRVFWPYG
jgi:hypothetical protein